jgi:hypothetical protein
MIYKCSYCEYHRSIHYVNGSVGIGCLAHDMSSPYPIDIRKLNNCPLGKDEKSKVNP